MYIKQLKKYSFKLKICKSAEPTAQSIKGVYNTQVAALYPPPTTHTHAQNTAQNGYLSLLHKTPTVSPSRLESSGFAYHIIRGMCSRSLLMVLQWQCRCCSYIFVFVNTVANTCLEQCSFLVSS